MVFTGEPAKNVILYSTGCPRCDVLKSKLIDKAVLFTENNSVDEMTALGITQVPVLCVNGILYEFKEAVEWVNNK